MKIRYNNIDHDVSEFYIQNDLIFFNNICVNLKNVQLTNNNINLHSLFEKIQDQLFTDIIFNFSDKYNDIHIQYVVSGNITSDIHVFIDINLLYINNTNILLTFIAHELGHVLYSQSELTYELTTIKFTNYIKYLLIALTTILCFKIYTIKLLSIIILIACSAINYLIVSKVKNFILKKINHNSEFFADEYAVKLTNSPLSVIQALVIIKKLFGDALNSPTHPAIDSRILHIQKVFWFKIRIEYVKNFIKYLFK